MEKVVLITGANSGVGRSLALLSASKGSSVVMVCRNRERGEKAKEDIIRLSGNNSVHLIIADLSSLDSVKNAAKEFKSGFNNLNVLVNNAGINLPSLEITSDGYEKVFATNHLAYFYLTSLLLGVLKSSAPSRIINVSSNAQSAININDLMSEKKYYQYKAYGRSKMANVLFTYELAERLKGTGVTVNAVHPGVVKTNIYETVHGFPRFLIGLMMPFFMSPGKSAEYIMPLMYSDEFNNVTGKYFYKTVETQTKKGSYDVDLRKKLWEVSENLVK
ncbi:MAG: SDR family oxidoreductase [Ignavibacteriae bacterium]|nr:SDR family oxidoreductase [Ignavibacteriota bacterium]